MRIFVAGATGAVGRRLVPMLVERDHRVAGTTRSTGKMALVREMGAQPFLVDALNSDQVMASVKDFQPDVIIDQITALSDTIDLRRFDRYFEATNRLRIEGTDNLHDAAVAANVGRMVAQSYTGWTNERSGRLVKTENDPIDPNPTANSRGTLAAIRHLEETVTRPGPVEGVVLRYGSLYGPGTSISGDGDVATMLRKRRMPIVGGGNGVWSHVHVDDAARAAVLAAEGGPPGIYNIVDNEPAAAHDWIPYLAAVLGAPSPMRVPAWMVRPVLGDLAVAMMTQIRGSSNAKARRDLHWNPAHSTWRHGFRQALN